MNQEDENSHEKEREETFNRYTKGLDLNEDILRDKRVLDLGCGEGLFVSELLDRGITNKAYGLDLNLEESKLDNDNFIKGDFEDELPIKNIDYILSVGALSLSFWADEDNLDIRTILKNSLDSLSDTGEIRIYPIQKPLEEGVLEGLDKSYKKWEELFDELEENESVDFEIRQTKEKKVGDDNIGITESVLIIRK